MQNSISIVEYLRQQVKLAERQKIDDISRRIEQAAAKRQKIDAWRQKLDAITYRPQQDGLLG